MKSFTILSIAAVALLFASCSKVEPKEGPSRFPNNDPSLIGFGVNTGSRVEDNTILDLDTVGGTDGLYVTQVLNGDGVKKAGFNEPYAYNGATYTWNWKNDPTNIKFKWPTTAENGPDYPMVFYSSFPTPAAAYTDGLWDVQIAATMAEKSGGQQDYLAARVSLDKAPSNGKAPLLFKHILSKVRFGMTTVPGVVVHIVSIKVVNVQDETSAATAPKYNLVEGAWVNPITTVATKATKSYIYTERNYFHNETSIDNGVFQTRGYGHLMLMPQRGTKVWDHIAFRAKAKEIMDANKGKTADELRAAWDAEMTATSEYLSGSRIEVIYSIEKAKEDNPTQGSGEYLIGDKYDEYDVNARYVRVGYVLDLTSTDANVENETEKKWSPNRQYTYDIELGTATCSGGILLDPFYLNKSGDNTNDPANNPSNMQPGEPISSGGYILLVPGVGDWINETNTIK